MNRFEKTVKTLDQLWPDLQQGDPKAIHEARKLTRKVQAQLRIASAPKRTKRAWRDLRRAVAPVRDRDAVGQHLLQALRELEVPPQALSDFEQAWAERRARTQAEVALPDLPPAVKRPKSWKARVKETLCSDAHELLREAEQVFQSPSTDPWHEWRKHLKRYRYTAELMGDAPEALLAVLEQLGRLQDAQVAQTILTEEDWVPQYREALLRREAEAQHHAQARVRDLWPALKAYLEQQEKSCDE
ncbi:CHAD domain-containing protein [Deinococcus multiflagellatus]|uniref:CHAD domain-containing protein n=1 Tax=Deinococcus multiflagellatus TaxID=1656887 RepID=A0ABW1ZSN4_9DEIO|nr:CHAD domain-containing protein [Deinococcus multiflagellatus]MBZ9716056.1 CHAD domain-containing protein [Deinococcus multiflagellatus]